MSRVIEVTVSPKGETTVQTKGYLGGDDRKTGEFYAAAQTEQQAHQ